MKRCIDVKWKDNSAKKLELTRTLSTYQNVAMASPNDADILSSFNSSVLQILSVSASLGNIKAFKDLVGKVSAKHD